MVARGNWTRQWWTSQLADFESVSSFLVIEELEKGDHPQKGGEAGAGKNVCHFCPSHPK